MPRKRNEQSENYHKAFPTTLRSLMDEHKEVTQQTLADVLGRSRQAISYYCDGSSSPDWETLVKIANFFSVSTDYLLGVSKIRNPDTSIRTICEVLGLSEQTVSSLILANGTRHEAVNAKKYEGMHTLFDFVKAMNLQPINQETDDPSYMVSQAHIISEGLLRFADDVVPMLINDPTIAKYYFSMTCQNSSPQQHSAADFLAALGAAYGVNQALISENDMKRFQIYEITNAIGNYLRSKYSERKMN